MNTSWNSFLPPALSSYLHMTFAPKCTFFACANFISITATIATNYKPNSHKTIGIYAEVFFAQGTINTFGVHIFKYLNNVSV
ncbi:hypothetical protein V8E52_006618 [Russula decolorans]